jgi:hypothetical protein
VDDESFGVSGGGRRMSIREDILPPTPTTIVCMLAFVEGKAYIAPAGSSLGNELDLWIRVDSLEAAADKLGVQLDNQGGTE